MSNDDDSVWAAASAGPPWKSSWRHARRGRRSARWWRRHIKLVWRDCRVRQHLERYYTGNRYRDTTWTVWTYDDPEVRHHLFCVRLGGEGRFGPAQLERHWTYTCRGEQWIEPSDEGPWFHILVQGRFAKHAMYRRGTVYYEDLMNTRRVKDPYFRWSQRQLQEEAYHGEMVSTE